MGGSETLAVSPVRAEPNHHARSRVLGGLATVWSLRCQRLFMGTLFTVFEFVAALVCKLRVWLHLQNPSLPRAELRPFLDNLLEWQRTRPLGAKWRSPKGPRPVLSLTAEVRTEWKKQK